jgi:hypothetical protein
MTPEVSLRECLRRVGCVALVAGVFGSLGGCNAVTAGGSSSRVGLLATKTPSGRIVVLRQQAEGIDCPGDGRYGDYAVAIQRAIASVRGANILTRVTLSSAEDTGLGGVGICVRAVGTAGRLE